MDRDVIPWLVVVVFASIWVAYIVRARRQSGQMAERSEALFRSMFSELQPYFHPHKLIEYVRARRDRTQSRSGGVWKNPPGFGVESAEIDYEQGRERVRLRDPTGAERAAFVYEESEEGGVLRVGKGKITVNLQDENHPRVRYWHPDREFKWKGGIWKFQSRIADREIESGDSTRFSGESSSSSPGPSIARGPSRACFKWKTYAARCGR